MIRIFCDCCEREIKPSEKLNKLNHWALSINIQGGMETAPKEDFICQTCQEKIDEKIKEIKNGLSKKT
jgi:hypothetical protein